MKKSILLTSILATILTACGGGGSNNTQQVITPSIYGGMAPESYSATLSNGSNLKTINYMLFPSNQESNILVLHLESQDNTTINLSSPLSITPTSCTFTNSSKDCTITVQNTGIVVNQNYVITPSYNSQSLQGINLSFATPQTHSSLLNLNGTWLNTSIVGTDPVTCEMATGAQVIDIISGNIAKYYDLNGTFITQTNIVNPVSVPTVINEGTDISTLSALANGVIMASIYSGKCATTSYATLTKISN